jgi:hypothetical protein
MGLLTFPFVGWSDVAKNLCYGMGATMGGIGALKFFWKSSEQIGRIPTALERAAAASEASMHVVSVLHDMHETQIGTENTLAVMAMEIAEVKLAIRENLATKGNPYHVDE